MRTSIYRQYLVEKLKLLSTQEHVWVAWEGMRLRLARPTATLGSGTAIVLKYRSRFYVVVVAAKDGLRVLHDWTANKGLTGKYIKPHMIAAVVEEPLLLCGDGKARVYHGGDNG